jgi:hypothetical protein
LSALTASSIVSAETSDSEMPPSLPVLIYSSSSTPNVTSRGTLRSRLAHSNTSRNLRPASLLRTVSIDFRTPSGEPSGWRFARFTPPLMLRTTFSASSGYFSK